MFPAYKYYDFWSFRLQQNCCNKSSSMWMSWCQMNGSTWILKSLKERDWLYKQIFSHYWCYWKYSTMFPSICPKYTLCLPILLHSWSQFSNILIGILQSRETMVMCSVWRSWNSVLCGWEGQFESDNLFHIEDKYNLSPVQLPGFACFGTASLSWPDGQGSL